MPFNTMPSSPGPEFPVTRKPTFDTNEVKFGDGYKLETPNGYNARTDTLTLNYENLTLYEMTVLKTFFDAHAPTTPFNVPTVFDGVGGSYTCKDFSHSRTNPGFYSFSATLVQYHGA